MLLQIVDVPHPYTNHPRDLHDHPTHEMLSLNPNQKRCQGCNQCQMKDLILPCSLQNCNCKVYKWGDSNVHNWNSREWS